MKLFGLSMMLFLLALNLRCAAQSCNGTLGSPVVAIDFGAGARYGKALPVTESDYVYSDNNAILNAQYSILNSTAGFYSQWFTTTDHTGNTNGYMMVLNCNAPGDVLYRKQMSNLCPNTTFECKAWILNLVNSALLKGIDVNLTFSVETTSGVVLNTYNTGNIPDGTKPVWVPASFYFTTPASGTPASVVLKIVNNSPGGDGNDLALDDITLRPCQPVVTASFSQTSSPTTLTLCEGSDAKYDLGVNVMSGYDNPVYQWQVNANDGNGWLDIPGETSTRTTVVFKAARSGIYEYRVVTAKAENSSLSCCQVFSSTAAVQVNPKPVPAASANTPICQGSTLNLTVAKGANYAWTGPGGFSSALQNPSINQVTAAQAGVYQVVLTSAEGCTATASVNVVINPPTSFSAGADVAICKGSSTVLNASGGVSYRWRTAPGLSDTTIANPVASPAVTTSYIVKITNQYSCVYTDTVVVSVEEKPVVDAGPDKKVIAGKSVRLAGNIQGGSNYTYYWLPNTYLSDPNTLSPLVTPSSDITYTLHVVSKSGCSESTAAVSVTIVQELFVPNTFSPNGDGVNDTWNITALDAYPKNVIDIYNRYGREIFRSIGNDKPWNGTVNGQPLPVGTYYYKITVNNGIVLKAGWVFLVR